MSKLAELARIAQQKSQQKAGIGPAVANLRSRSVWREVFGGHATHKERGTVGIAADPREQMNKPVPGGSYARSASSTTYWASFKRLLDAMRSMAPGGWSDDRWEQSRNLVSIAFVAITAKCRILSQSEFQVFRKDRRAPDGKRPINEDEDPKAYELIRLLEKPNPQDSFGDLMWRWNQQQDLTGMALTWMVPNQLGKPMELYAIPTAIAIPQPAVNPEFPDGYYRIQPVYPYGPFSSYPTPASAVGAAIPAQWMLRFMYPHPILRYDGYSPLTGLRLEMDELNMVNRSRHYSMRKAINPSAVVDLSEMEEGQPWTDEQIDRMRTEFENVFYGPENAGGIIVPPPGGKIEPWGANPVDMDYPQGWDQLTNFLLSGFGITKPAAGMVEDSSYSTLYATLKQLDLLTLQPWRDSVAAKLTRQLACFFGDDLIIEIRGKRVDDDEIKGRKLDKLIQTKSITHNQLLKELEMPMTDEPWGDERVGMDEQQGIQGVPGGGAMGVPSDAAGGDQPSSAEMLDEAIAGGGDDSGEEPSSAEMLDEALIEKTRPRPGKLGEGSLGPRDQSLPKSLQRRIKSLHTPRTKSLYQQAREVLGNGH